MFLRQQIDQQIDGFFFLIHSISLCLLIGEFRPIRLKVIIEMCGNYVQCVVDFWCCCSGGILGLEFGNGLDGMKSGGQKELGYFIACASWSMLVVYG